MSNWKRTAPDKIWVGVCFCGMVLSKVIKSSITTIGCPCGSQIQISVPASDISKYYYTLVSEAGNQESGISGISGIPGEAG